MHRCSQLWSRFFQKIIIIIIAFKIDIYASWRNQRGIGSKSNYQVVGEIHDQSALRRDLDNLRRVCRMDTRRQPWNTVDFTTLYSMETAWVPSTAVSLGKVSVCLFCLTCHLVGKGSVRYQSPFSRYSVDYSACWHHDRTLRNYNSKDKICIFGSWVSRLGLMISYGEV